MEISMHLTMKHIVTYGMVHGNFHTLPYVSLQRNMQTYIWQGYMEISMCLFSFIAKKYTEIAMCLYSFVRNSVRKFPCVSVFVLPKER